MEHRKLYLQAETIRPDDPDVAWCWQIFLQAFMAGYLQDAEDVKDVGELIVHAGSYADRGYEELMVEIRDGRLKVSLVGHSEECDAAKMAAVLEQLERVIKDGA